MAQNDRAIHEKELVNKLNEIRCFYRKIEDDFSFQFVYNLFVGGIFRENDVPKLSGGALNYIGIYHEDIIHELSKARAYYLRAIEKGNLTAMNNLGLMLQAKSNRTEARKYFLKALENGEIHAAYLLGDSFQWEGNMPEAKKYYMMYLEHADEIDNYNKAFNRLVDIYEMELLKNDKIDECPDDFIHFISIKKIQHRLPFLFRMIANLYNEGIEYIDLHVNYSPNSEGAKKAKEDFTARFKQTLDKKQ